MRHLKEKSGGEDKEKNPAEERLKFFITLKVLLRMNEAQIAKMRASLAFHLAGPNMDTAKQPKQTASAN